MSKKENVCCEEGKKKRGNGALKEWDREGRREESEARVKVLWRERSEEWEGSVNEER